MNKLHETGSSMLARNLQLMTVSLLLNIILYEKQSKKLKNYQFLFVYSTNILNGLILMEVQSRSPKSFLILNG